MKKAVLNSILLLTLCGPGAAQRPEPLPYVGSDDDGNLQCVQLF